MEEEYKINEIFYSIQGEGRNTGMPAHFIRFAGCNLNCFFCDTDKQVNAYLSIPQIMQIITKKAACKNVILTGGEPTLQNLKPLVLELKSKDFYVAIETNGTNWCSALPLIDWITISPKEGAPLKVKIVNELKVVYTGQDLEQFIAISADYRYLQPMELRGRTNIHEVIDIVRGNDLWHLSVQLHKLLKIR